MTPFNLPLTVTKGLAYGPATIFFKQVDNTPFDLTAGGTWKVIAYARHQKNSKEKIDLKPQITDAVNGTVVITFTDEETQNFMAGDYGYDLIFESPDGVRTGPYFAGAFKVREIYTHN